eukprot:285638-Hanusia_phi.AAC.1
MHTDISCTKQSDDIQRKEAKQDEEKEIDGDKAEYQYRYLRVAEGAINKFPLPQQAIKTSLHPSFCFSFLSFPLPFSALLCSHLLHPYISSNNPDHLIALPTLERAPSKTSRAAQRNIRYRYLLLLLPSPPPPDPILSLLFPASSSPALLQHPAPSQNRVFLAGLR